MASFDTIPHELVQIILHTFLHLVSVEALWPTRRVCRTWHDIVDAEMAKLAVASFGQDGEARLEILALSGTVTSHYIGITTRFNYIDPVAGLAHFECASLDNGNLSSPSLPSSASAKIRRELDIFKLILNDHDKCDYDTGTNSHQILTLYPFHDPNICHSTFSPRSQKVFCYIDILLSPSGRRFRRTSEFPNSEEVAMHLGKRKELRWPDVAVMYRMQVNVRNEEVEGSKRVETPHTPVSPRPMVGIEFLAATIKLEQVFPILKCRCEMAYPSSSSERGT
ncbi:hypothetical protein BC937DRAFT_91312 [Endogone sp. FLAS-F59071]|nr:hypothetical protein BC937DRAFT_91312 [Endogone sp. FLAS-F59071]|eukprot:RUS16351.1 hypothetical protein BC937DRAFT_91312 [Endogone sp. FLAS-F59071]